MLWPMGALLGFCLLIGVAPAAALPVLLKALKIDPAVASGPILTTVTDMCGFFLVLATASLMLPLLGAK